MAAALIRMDLKSLHAFHFPSGAVDGQSSEITSRAWIACNPGKQVSRRQPRPGEAERNRPNAIRGVVLDFLEAAAHPHNRANALLPTP